MRVFLTSLVLTVTIISSCAATDALRLQNQAVMFATSEKKLDQSEYDSLTEIILKSTDVSLERFLTENGKQVDHPKFVQYLKTLFETKKIPINPQDIWQPTNSDVTAKFNVNVYIENSASMDAYFAGVTELETVIYNMLANLKISGVSEVTSLSFVNSKVTFSKDNISSQEIDNLITKIEPETFRKLGGDRGVTDIKDVVKLVLDKVDEKNAAILISDFVFSPGKNANAQDYLNNQTVGLKINFAEKLKELDLAVAIIQLSSNFNGNYYDRTGQIHKLNCQRPYYLWVIGSTDQVRTLLHKNILTDIKGGYLNRIVFYSDKSPETLDYKIQFRPQFGDLPDGAKGPITKAKVSKDGTFGFNVAVDFSRSLQDMNYFLDPYIYRVSNNSYKLSVDVVSSNDNSLSGYTHMLKFVADNVNEETLTVDVMNGIPTWVTTSNSSDDLSIACENDESKKTFGLKNEVDGIAEAFYSQNRVAPLGSFSVSIRK